MQTRHRKVSGTLLGLLIVAIVVGAQMWPKDEARDAADPQNRPRQQRQGDDKFIREFSAKVIRVADGDTLTCLENGKETRVRLFGIDSPETDQPGYAEARNALRQAVDGKTVEVRVVDIDQYERLVATIFLPGMNGGEETNINRQQVESGMAWWYRTYAPDDKDLAAAENSAKAAGRGVWREVNPLPPWEFRRRGREQNGQLP
jgi:endonuclease YncB( thermonuclease family)